MSLCVNKDKSISIIAIMPFAHEAFGSASNVLCQIDQTSPNSTQWKVGPLYWKRGGGTSQCVVVVVAAAAL